MVSIGGRYTVRGFDGEYTLTGESGWYWQNEIAAYFQELDASLYIGLDLGMIYGPSVETQFGHSLMGAVPSRRTSPMTSSLPHRSGAPRDFPPIA